MTLYTWFILYLYFTSLYQFTGCGSSHSNSAVEVHHSHYSSASAPSIKAKPVKLQECPEICDKEPRELKFAIRATDLESWTSSSQSGQEPTNSDPKAIQHWALVAYCPKGEIINLFEAWKDENGQLEAVRRRFAIEDIEIFNKADFIGMAKTSPCQLLEIAKQVKTGKYSALFNNNCQTWLKEYLKQININCGSSLSLPIQHRIGLINGSKKTKIDRPDNIMQFGKKATVCRPSSFPLCSTSSQSNFA
jgi:hypothetical protein